MSQVSLSPSVQRPLLPVLAIAVCTVVAFAGVFLPWYAPQIAPPLTPNSATGWDATGAGRITAIGAGLAFAASVLLGADTRHAVRLDALGAMAVSLVALLGITVAACAVGFATLRLPEPAEHITRQIGIYVSLAAALTGVAVAMVQVLLVMQPPQQRREGYGERSLRR